MYLVQKFFCYGGILQVSSLELYQRLSDIVTIVCLRVFVNCAKDDNKLTHAIGRSLGDGLVVDDDDSAHWITFCKDLRQARVDFYSGTNRARVHVSKKPEYVSN